MSYKKFLESKKKIGNKSGFKISIESINSKLFYFQRHIVKKAVECGKFSIFAECGLGKTFMQLEFSRIVNEKEAKPVLIVAPLAVSLQTIREGVKIGVKVEKYLGQVESGIYITNYEQLDNIDPSLFCAVILDESSILKNCSGKIRNKIISDFSETKYKLACTATPSPNDLMEIGNHSEFMGSMTREEMLSMFFVHDGGDTSKWRLKGHCKDDFYSFLKTWSIAITKPSDIGFSDNGYDLPELDIKDHKIETEKKDNGDLFNSVAINATEFNQELKRTLEDRMNLCAEIVNSTKDQVLVWIKRNDEGDYLRKLIPDAVEVSGSDSIESKEKNLIGFANGDFRVLITKPKIAQFGLNYQNCHRQVFASLDFSFEGLYQAIRRSYRFGQVHSVTVDVISTDTMSNVLESINKKQDQFNEFRDYYKKSIERNVELMAVETVGKVESDDYTIYNGDSCSLIKEIESESIGFSVFSPPFADLYTYSDKIEDMGNSKNHNEFLEHFKYLAVELNRILMSGRNIAVHCMDIPAQKGKDGYIGLKDFSGDLIEIFQESGFIYHSRVTIWKDPVVEMQRTKALGLLHKQVKKDSTMSRVGIPDYLLVFRKKGDNINPVQNTGISVDLWQKYASPVWYDINYSNTLQFRSAREEKDEKHICPLQLETIERAIHLWTNEGDTVFSPFMGIGSEGYQSLKMRRKFKGIELKESYFNLACKNIQSAIDENGQLNLF